MRNFLPKYQDSHVSYLIGNVIKYVLRAPSKGKELQDLMKAKEYLDLAIKELEKENDGNSNNQRYGLQRLFL